MTVKSINGFFIRLTDERTNHIVSNHPELNNLMALICDAIENPDSIHAGHNQELLAVKFVRNLRKTVIVIYREYSDNEIRDGFIITAYLTSHPDSVIRRQKLWP